MKVIIIPIILNFIFIQLLAFEPWFGYSTNGLAGISTFNVQNNNPYYNPAQFTDSLRFSINLSRIQINGLSGIKANYLGITKQFSNGSYSIIIANYYTVGFQEIKLGIANGIKLSNKLHLGINTRMNRISIIGNGQSSYIYSNISVNSNLFKDNSVTAICEFPYRFKNSDFTHLSEVTTLKIGWHNFSGKKLNLMAEMSLNTIGPMITRFGICYQNKRFNLVLGFEPRSKIIGAGMGLKFKKSHIGLSNINHLGLGQILCFDANYAK